MEKIKIMMWVGSLREKSYNRALAQHIRNMTSSQVLWDVPDIGALPFFNEDLEGENYPDEVLDFRKHLTEAQGLMIISPEYNWSIPGVIKNAIDWGSRPSTAAPLAGKSVFIAGASQGPVGTARMHLALRQVFAWTKNPVWNPHDMLVSFAAQKFDVEGHLTDEPTIKNLEKQVTGYLEFLGKN